MIDGSRPERLTPFFITHLSEQLADHVGCFQIVEFHKKRNKSPTFYSTHISDGYFKIKVIFKGDACKQIDSGEIKLFSILRGTIANQGAHIFIVKNNVSVWDYHRLVGIIKPWRFETVNSNLEGNNLISWERTSLEIQQNQFRRSSPSSLREAVVNTSPRKFQPVVQSPAPNIPARQPGERKLMLLDNSSSPISKMKAPLNSLALHKSPDKESMIRSKNSYEQIRKSSLKEINLTAAIRYESKNMKSDSNLKSNSKTKSEAKSIKVSQIKSERKSDDSFDFIKAKVQKLKQRPKPLQYLSTKSNKASSKQAKSRQTSQKYLHPVETSLKAKSQIKSVKSKGVREQRVLDMLSDQQEQSKNQERKVVSDAGSRDSLDSQINWEQIKILIDKSKNKIALNTLLANQITFSDMHLSYSSFTSEEWVKIKMVQQQVVSSDLILIVRGVVDGKLITLTVLNNENVYQTNVIYKMKTCGINIKQPSIRYAKVDFQLQALNDYKLEVINEDRGDPDSQDWGIQQWRTFIDNNTSKNQSNDAPYTSLNKLNEAPANSLHNVAGILKSVFAKEQRTGQAGNYRHIITIACPFTQASVQVCLFAPKMELEAGQPIILYNIYLGWYKGSRQLSNKRKYTQIQHGSTISQLKSCWRQVIEVPCLNKLFLWALTGSESILGIVDNPERYQKTPTLNIVTLRRPPNANQPPLLFHIPCCQLLLIHDKHFYDACQICSKKVISPLMCRLCGRINNRITRRYFMIGTVADRTNALSVLWTHEICQTLIGANGEKFEQFREKYINRRVQIWLRKDNSESLKATGIKLLDSQSILKSAWEIMKVDATYI